MFSICIPHYNSGGKIRRCLSSIIEQPNYSPHKVEIVLVDDQSTDNSLGDLQQFESIKIHQNPVRLGLTQNWNRTLSLGKGQIRMLLHQDDWLAEGALREIQELFQTDEKIAFAAFGQVYHPDDGSPSKQAPRDDIGIYTGQEYFQRCMTFYDIPAPSTAVFRGTFLDNLDNIYDSKYLYCSEMDLYTRLALAFPKARFHHDMRLLIDRGISQNRFSYRHPGYRILDFCRILKTYSPLLTSEEQKSLASRKVRDSVINDFRSILQLGDSVQLDKVINDKIFVEWLNSDRENLKSLSEFLQPESKSMTYPTTKQSFTVSTSGNHTVNPWRNYLLNPVIILGFHHSGTRLLAKLLDEMGIFQVVDRQTYEWGYIQDINDRMLPEWYNPVAVKGFNARLGSFDIPQIEIANLLQKNGYQNDRLWAHKDPRTCSTIGAWLEAYPEAQLVHIVRDPLDVLGTLPQAYDKFTPSKMKPQDALDHWADLWASNVDTVNNYRDQAANFIEITFEALCQKPQETLLKLTETLGISVGEWPDVSKINVKKIGVHREWLADGRLDEDNVEFLRQRLASYRTLYGYDENEKLHIRSEFETHNMQKMGFVTV